MESQLPTSKIFQVHLLRMVVVLVGVCILFTTTISSDIFKANNEDELMALYEMYYDELNDELSDFDDDSELYLEYLYELLNEEDEEEWPSWLYSLRNNIQGWLKPGESASVSVDHDSAPNGRGWSVSYRSYSSQGSSGRAKIRKCIKQCVADKVLAAYNAGQTTDCADTAIKAVILCAKKCKVPIRLRYYDARNKKWAWVCYKDYSHINGCIRAAQRKMRSTTLLSNTRPQEWADIEPGDIFVFDLKFHGDSGYAGHVMVVIGKKDSSGKYKVIEGHLSGGITMGRYTKQELLDKWRTSSGETALKDGKGRYWDWKKIIKDC